MTEFRTYEPESDGSDGLDLEGMLKKVWQNIQKDPQMQARLAKSLQEQGIDPSLLGAVKPGMGNVPQAASPEESNDQAQAKPEVKTVTEKPEPEEIEELLEDIIDQFGEDKTLGDLREFIGENPEVVETAIKLRL